MLHFGKHFTSGVLIFSAAISSMKIVVKKLAMRISKKLHNRCTKVHSNKLHRNVTTCFSTLQYILHSNSLDTKFHHLSSPPPPLLSPPLLSSPLPPLLSSSSPPPLLFSLFSPFSPLLSSPSSPLPPPPLLLLSSPLLSSSSPLLSSPFSLVTQTA